MQRAAAKFVLAGWMIIAVCMVTACSQTGSAVSSLASSVAASVTRSAPSLPAVPSREATTAGNGATSPSAEPTQSSAPATETAPATAPASAAPTATATTQGTSGSVSPWVWVAIGAVALIALIAGIIAWTARGHRRRGAATAEWRKQLIDAYAKGAALHDAMAAAEVPGALAAADAPARWYDIQRRADDFGQLLYMLRESATDEEDRIRISNVLASLQAARSAMDAERAAGGADSSLAAVVRDRLMFFRGSLSGLREPDSQL